MGWRVSINLTPQRIWVWAPWIGASILAPSICEPLTAKTCGKIAWEEQVLPCVLLAHNRLWNKKIRDSADQEHLVCPWPQGVNLRKHQCIRACKSAANCSWCRANRRALWDFRTQWGNRSHLVCAPWRVGFFPCFWVFFYLDNKMVLNP